MAVLGCQVRRVSSVKALAMLRQVTPGRRGDTVEDFRPAGCKMVARMGARSNLAEPRAHRRSMSRTPQDRDAASMFYIGYQASRIRATTINVGLIPSIEDQALVYCTENPDEPVARAFAEAYLHTR
jgi:hypothetical protein